MIIHNHMVIIHHFLIMVCHFSSNASSTTNISPTSTSHAKRIKSRTLSK
ncbi:hypothetical protein Gogos_014910 [Gossypium gossypioides]|uniref:Uncharacterized protein n=1 Tax=Gossypium gossypioides TaxID=34282 RepID=A0A7J9C003_GOSGO|nr:hypothetical protein [Gossypium gossypioides]